ncbi:exopolyphosphatase [Bacillus phage Moonbeam]|uniref:Exopolyphosphatase n=1 Tax=Bacillus phage Moonbeam TaxID=1540091 RepID=A0A0A0RSM8_9CAUD|nr:exopolyphosphatase [Bacillus phage Moonbeam]AIW03531.1 hypothetical protein CPT_Moonbeam133 [Bacillus phage Moonbeam]
MAVEETVIKVYTPPSFEGVTSIAILEELLQESAAKLDVHYVSHLDFRDYQQFSDANVILVLGLPYKGYTLPEEFSIAVGNPFTHLLHLSTYGEPILEEGIASFVDESIDPIMKLSYLLKDERFKGILGTYVFFTEKAEMMIQAVNAYRTWTWENNNVTRVLLALYQGSFKWLPHMVRGKSLQEVIEAYAPVIQGQMQKQRDYIERKIEMTRECDVIVLDQHCKLKIVFAEEYINELANELLTRDKTEAAVIVCVARTTKSNDMFSIRTKGIHAGQIAKWVNNGGGKEQVASVFTGISYAELLMDGLIKTFAQLHEEY